MPTAAIVARQLRRVYPRAPPGVAAIDSLDLEVPSGGVYGLIGRNGAGKTTFVRIAATQLKPTSGTLEVLGTDAVRTPERVRPRIACVPQESRPLYFLTVEQAARFNLQLRGFDRRESRRRTTEVLEELSLADVRHRSISRLSGGQRRRVMVAMILATDAELLFLDEPTTGLDPLARREVWAALRRVRREARTILLTTHYLDEAESLSDRLALIEKGRVILEGTPAELRRRVAYPFRVTLRGGFAREELDSFGRVSSVEDGFLVFAQEPAARELARLALERGVQVALGPADLEDIFLEVVGRPIDAEENAPDDGERP